MNGEPRLLLLWRALAGCWVGLVVWLSLTTQGPDLPQPFPGFDKLEHFSAYLFLMGWCLQGWREETERWGIAAFLIALGAALELLQALGGVRYFELLDMAANTSGVITGLLLGYTRAADLAIDLERRLLPPRSAP